ncbi:hypothetical protein Q3G72_015813 [Acer saccharum]|nr:hypothetical protein Q3G72_015813 [Acer saccharum]
MLRAKGCIMYAACCLVEVINQYGSALQGKQLDVKILKPANGHLPLDIGNLRAVTHIDLASNELSGEIPSSIGNLQTLSNFSIAHNKLEGRIPESFGNVINLEILNLSSNNLSGAIPKSLEKLRYLKYFNVSFNRLDGEIPTGGAFANFSAESFIGNGQLCGAPRLQVPPCKTEAKRGKEIL